MGVGVGAVGLASSLQPGRPELVGGDLPINVSGTQRLAVEAHNSPGVVVNPLNRQNLVVGARMDAPQFGCSVHLSLDGGSTWTATALPGAPGTVIPCFAPDIAFGPGGTLYAAFTSMAPVEGRGTVPDGLWVSSSSDGGRTFSAPTKAHGPSPFEVRLAADPHRQGRVYLSWVEASSTSSWGFSETGNPILVAHSDDGGVTWGAPVRVSPPGRARVVAPSLAVGSSGDAYVAYLDVGDDRLDYNGGHEGRGGEPFAGPWALVVAHSQDVGATWRETTVDDALRPVQRFLVLFPPAPSLAVDPDGHRLYVAFHDGRSGDADVYLWRSDNRGQTWSPGRRVADVPVKDGRSQYLPAVSVAANGRLDVVYYDRSNDATDTMNEVSLQSSDDGGRTFTHRLSLASRAFDSRIGFGSDRDMAELGSRLGLASTPRGALAVWADTRGGTTLTGRQDLARAVITFPAANALRSPLNASGVAFGVLGIAIMLWALVGGRLRRPVPTQSIPPGAAASP